MVFVQGQNTEHKPMETVDLSQAGIDQPQAAPRPPLLLFSIGSPGCIPPASMLPTTYTNQQTNKIMAIAVHSHSLPTAHH